jgi:hypothetical protein
MSRSGRSLKKPNVEEGFRCILTAQVVGGLEAPADVWEVVLLPNSAGIAWG